MQICLSLSSQAAAAVPVLQHQRLLASSRRCCHTVVPFTSVCSTHRAGAASRGLLRAALLAAAPARGRLCCLSAAPGIGSWKAAQPAESQGLFYNAIVAAMDAESTPAPLVVVEGDVVSFHMTCKDKDGQVGCRGWHASSDAADAG